MNKPADPTLKPVLVYIPEKLRRRLKIRAIELEMTCTALITRAIEKEVR